jgi:hypothetical protein
MPSGFFYAIAAFGFITALCLLYGIFISLSSHKWMRVDGKVTGFRSDSSKGLTLDGEHDLFDQANQNTTTQVYISIRMENKDHELIMNPTSPKISMGDVVKLRVHPAYPQLFNQWESEVNSDKPITKFFTVIASSILAVFCLVLSFVFLQMA